MKQECPLCHAEARYRGFDYGERKHFVCPSCGEYIITSTAERKLVDAPEEWRSTFASAPSLAAADEIYEIVTELERAGLRLYGVAVKRRDRGC